MKLLSSRAMRVATRAVVLAALAAGVTAHAQGKTPPASDMETQTAVADYNAGNFTSALAEFRKAAQRGSRLAEFNYAMMLLNGEGGPANVEEGKKWLRVRWPRSGGSASMVFEGGAARAHSG